ncbi:nuclear transport factor 2 family protein [Microbulbifer variabilis]|uniref:Nuclear transport factor 2 family protein n=1 Tax=Microbulbifer variabilis TaxID=266805 RepID=A0ABY4VGC0_9GAMM|nr:nuclear transport factor 2 family protein [Microbulbifer variabilis]USD23234.1 nuclear transport factor 2 family protein [Microbulbifer variabilis]
MTRTFFGLLLLFVTASCYADKRPEAFNTIDKLFAAMSNFDHQAMRNTVTDSFILLEHGEIWTIEDLVNVVKPAGYTRTNYFSIINYEQQGELLTVNYWNKANFTQKNKSEDVIWLESAVLAKVDGNWLLRQMHSTRLPAGKTPDKVTFIKQKL